MTITTEINKKQTSLYSLPRVKDALKWFKGLFSEYAGADKDMISYINDDFGFYDCDSDKCLRINMEAFEGDSITDEVYIAIEGFYMDSIDAKYTRCYILVSRDYARIDENGDHPYKWECDHTISGFDGKELKTYRKAMLEDRY